MLRAINAASDTAVQNRIDSVDLTIRVVRSKKRYVLQDDYRLRNDLLTIVGFLEFFNSLDWPANVFNQKPVPVFAAALMGICGGVILFASSAAYFDFVRSWRNIGLLRQERHFLLEQAKHSATLHVQAWLSLNFRELGWEIVDRALMDFLGGTSAILVGAGTLLAIGGNNDKVFLASNLLSGYVGNSFVAVYALINTVWAIFLFKRGSNHKSVIQSKCADTTLRNRSGKTFKKHQTYALVNAVTLLVSGAGSIITAQRPWGYFMLIPCVISSVVLNIFWRRCIGFSRQFVQYRGHSAFTFDILAETRATLSMMDELVSGRLVDRLSKCSSAELINFTLHYGLFQDLSLHIARDDELRRLVYGDGTAIDVSLSKVLAIDVALIFPVIQQMLERQGKKCLVDRERMLHELLAAYWYLSERQNVEMSSEPDLEKAEGSQWTRASFDGLPVTSNTDCDETRTSSPQSEPESGQRLEQGSSDSQIVAEANSQTKPLDTVAHRPSKEAET